MNAKKVMGVMLCIAMVATVFAVVMPMNVSAQLPPDEVWVDDDYYDGGYNDGHTWGVDAFAEIQDGIDAVAVGGTAHVNEGTYTENVVVNKTLNLIGEDWDKAIIDGGGTGDVIYVSADWVNITGFTITNGGGAGHPIIDAGIDIRSDNNTIIGNKVTSTERFGIFLWDAHWNEITDNIVSSNGWAGIRPFRSNHIIIKGNNVTSTQCWGIHPQECDDITIIGNNAYSNGYHGIYDYRSTNSIVSGNKVYSNGYDGILGGSCGSIIANNIVYSNKNGINLWLGVADNTVTGNNIYSNSKYGIYIHESDDNTIKSNTISNNNYGIYIDGDWLRSTNNLIYHNHIIGNTNQAYDFDPENNDWNHTGWLEGNYWSDYTGVDCGGMSYPWDPTGKHLIAGDGIGDTEVPHPWEHYDYYPFTDLCGRVHNIDKDLWYAPIQEAIDDADPSNTLEAMMGTYNENVVVNKPVTITGKFGALSTIIDGGGNEDVVHITANWVNITGFTVTGSGLNIGDAGIELYNANNCIISNNSISNNTFGINITQSSNVIVENNIVLNNDVGIYSYNSSPIIRYNNISYNNNYGIWNDYYSNSIIGNNTITHNYGWGGIRNHHYSNASIDNNTISYNTCGILLTHSSPIITFNNITFNIDGNLVINAAGVNLSASDPILHWNNIDNINYYLCNGYDENFATINATDNWWGSAIEEEFKDKITGKVDYDPWLLDDVDEAGPG